MSSFNSSGFSFDTSSQYTYPNTLNNTNNLNTNNFNTNNLNTNNLNTNKPQENVIVECLTETKNINLAILNEIKKLSNALETKSVNRHVDVSCDACEKKEITGIRYKCLFCKDYDLCESCEKIKLTVHSREHFFIKIEDSYLFQNMLNIVPSAFSI